MPFSILDDGQNKADNPSQSDSKYEIGEEVVMSVSNPSAGTAFETFKVANLRRIRGVWNYQLQKSDGTLHNSGQWVVQSALEFARNS
jgi:hypothetical protein